jgi:glycolate oxidase
MWKARKHVAGALGRISKGCYSHDVVVPPSRLAEALGKISALAERRGVRVATVAHAGDGNLHPLLLFDTRSEEEIDRVCSAGREIVELAVALGGSITGEHGVGAEKRGLLGLQYGTTTLSLFRRIRDAFDPSGLMNAAKLVPDTEVVGEFPRGEKPPRAGWL